MASSFIPQASLFLGIIPALILLYISIGGYEKWVKQKYMFVIFIVGIIIGFLAAIMELFTSTIGILFIILFPVFEQLFKTIILNLRRLQEKQAAVVYGLVLGLGFGAISTPVSIIMGRFQGGDLSSLGLVVIGSCGIIMFHAATGVMIGFGVYAGKLVHYVILAILVQIPITLGVFVSGSSLYQFLQIALVIVVFVYGLALFWYATKKIMPRLLSETQRRRRVKKEIEIKGK